MDDIVLRGFGFWLLAILNAVIVFISYFVGHAANGLDPMFVSLILTMLMTTEIFLVLIIRFYFKLPDETD